MQTSEARRSQRVHYRAAVELRVREGVFDASAVHAEAIDLGAGGMRIAARVHVPVGAPVTCHIELDGHAASLPGRIAWLAHGDGERGNGIGICFDPLGNHERALLQETVERSRGSYRAIELRFAGVEPPIRARARARTNGLKLSAVLPILARGTELSFRLDEEGPQFKGRVSDASLHEEQGARRIEVDVEVEDRDGVRFRRRARYGYPLEIEAEELREAAALPPAQDVRVPAAPSVAPRARALRLSALLLAASAGALLGWTAARSSASTVAVSQPAHVVVPREPAPARHRSTVAAFTPAPAATRAPATAFTPGAPPQAEPSEQVRSPETASVEPVALAPELRVDGAVTRVLVPFEGTLDDMHARLWASPFALVIDLPNGHSKLSTGVHRLRKGSARDLRIQHRAGGGEFLRLTLATPIARYAVAAQNGTLELRLVRAAEVAARP
jgi:hypothetical protein